MRTEPEEIELIVNVHLSAIEEMYINFGQVLPFATLFYRPEGQSTEYAPHRAVFNFGPNEIVNNLDGLKNRIRTLIHRDFRIKRQVKLLCLIWSNEVGYTEVGISDDFNAMGIIIKELFCLFVETEYGSQKIYKEKVKVSPRVNRFGELSEAVELKDFKIDPVKFGTIIDSTGKLDNILKP